MGKLKSKICFPNQEELRLHLNLG